MDPTRFRDAFQRLQLLDDRLVYKVRPRNMGSARVSVEQLDDRVRDLSQLTVELKEILQELFLALGTRPRGDSTDDGPTG